MVYTDVDRHNDFDYFVKNHKKLFSKYGHKFLVIRFQAILGVYDNIVNAIDSTTVNYPIGTFIVQECTEDESGYTNYVSSWQICV